MYIHIFIIYKTSIVNIDNSIHCVFLNINKYIYIRVMSNKHSKNKDDDYFEQHTYTTHNGYTKENDKEPVYYGKCRRHRKDSYDESSDEEPFDETIHANIMKDIHKNFENIQNFNPGFTSRKNTGGSKSNKSDKKSNIKSDKKSGSKSNKKSSRKSKCNRCGSKYHSKYYPENIFEPNFYCDQDFMNGIPNWHRKIHKNILKNNPAQFNQFSPQFNQPFGPNFVQPFGPNFVQPFGPQFNQFFTPFEGFPIPFYPGYQNCDKHKQYKNDKSDKHDKQDKSKK
nr:hypothetical protein [Megavirus caiporensis]